MDKKKNIKIVTMNASYNYGAMLQAYALQEALKSLSYLPEFIDQREVVTKPKIADGVNPLRSFFNIFYGKQVARGHSRFDEFVANYQSVTKKNYSDYSKLKGNPPAADVYLTGSDQVWNPGSLRPINFLEFVKDGAKKISYAASLGVSEIPDHRKEMFKEYIKDFDSISIREDEGKNEVQKLTDKKIEVHIDPVFLLESESWNSVSYKIKGINQPYILCYILFRPKWLNSYLKRLHKQTGLKVILIDNSAFRNIFYNKMIRNAGPSEFLWLMANAEIVITSSFHGTAFATIFNKPFYTIVNPAFPSRITNLMKKLNLEDRILIDEVKFDFENIDFSNANETIVKERLKSLAYLKNSID